MGLPCGEKCVGYVTETMTMLHTLG